MADWPAVLVEDEGKAACEGALNAEGTDLLVHALQGEIGLLQRLHQEAGDLAVQQFKVPTLPLQSSPEQADWTGVRTR